MQNRFPRFRPEGSAYDCPNTDGDFRVPSNGRSAPTDAAYATKSLAVFSCAIRLYFGLCFVVILSFNLQRFRRRKYNKVRCSRADGGTAQLHARDSRPTCWTLRTECFFPQVYDPSRSACDKRNGGSAPHGLPAQKDKAVAAAYALRTIRPESISLRQPCRSSPGIYPGAAALAPQWLLRNCLRVHEDFQDLKRGHSVDQGDG